MLIILVLERWRQEDPWSLLASQAELVTSWSMRDPVSKHELDKALNDSYSGR